MHGLAAADKVLNHFRKNKWTKLCLYSICYIICIDYKYENGNSCYISNTVVHIYLQYIKVWFLQSVCYVLDRLFQHSVWGDQYSQSQQLHCVWVDGHECIFVLFFSSCGTITNVQLWISMTYGDFLTTLLLRYLAGMHIFANLPNNFSFLLQPYDNEDPPYVKVRHDHLYTYSFTILYVYHDMQRMTQ